MNNMFSTTVLIGKSIEDATKYLAKVDPNLLLFVERENDKLVVKRLDEPMMSHRVNVVVERGRIIEAFFDSERKMPAVKAVKFDYDALVGRSVSDATLVVQDDGKFTNITKIDGEFVQENLDLCHVLDRVNLEVENGMVVRASRG